VPSVEELLDRVADADDAPYRARQLVVSFGDGESAAVLDVQSSRRGRFVRAESGSDVTRLWSQEQMGAVDGVHRSKHQGDVAQVRVRPSSVLRKYAVEAQGSEELLGVELMTLTLARREDATVAERWWVHPKTGVLYRRELFDRSGELVGLATLLDMRWGRPGPSEPVAAEAETGSQVETIEAPDAPRRLDGSYELWRAYGIEVDGRPSEQWVYSDGLHALSVFRTEGNLAVPASFSDAGLEGLSVFVGPGPGTWAWQGSGSSYLLVAEEAALEVAELIKPFPKGGPSFWARLGSVWSRLFRGLGSLFS
jgi:hypothetical protein